ncbi:unnamed protein product [Rodentolepis nana]|uniref:EH domain-containing protein n=1 Tax=Rodentolepis nana TaxID=102285 RepID=A0A0R3T1A9_RODNA|nr:unnamed protein product [Rodentolepis nana]
MLRYGQSYHSQGFKLRIIYASITIKVEGPALCMDSMDSHDAWAMTSDQKAYYLAQFLRLQPNPSGFLSGQAAKAFFELSKLPVSNLSQIW